MPAEAVDPLLSAGHEADTVIEEGLRGSSDARIIDVTKTAGRVLITLDLDFSDIRAYPPSDHNGIVVLRLGSQDKIKILTAMKRLISVLTDEDPRGKLWIIEPDRLRIRSD